MKILIDADACNRRNQIINEARQKGIEVHIFCDTSHMIFDDYAEVHIADRGRNSADMLLLKYVREGDIVYTNDKGLAGMAQAMRAEVKSFAGKRFKSADLMAAYTSRSKCGTRYYKTVCC